MNINEYLKKNFPHTTSFFSGLTLFIVDAIVLFLCIGAGFFIVNIFDSSDINFKSFINYSIYIPFILILFTANGLYPGIMNSPTEDIKHYFGCTFFSFIAIILTAYVAKINEYAVLEKIFEDSTTIAISISFLIALPICTFALPALRECAKHYFSRFKWWGVPVVIYCDKDGSNYIIEKLSRLKYLGYHPALIINSSAKEVSEFNNIPVYPPSDEIHKIIKDYNDGIIKIDDITEVTYKNYLDTKDIPDPDLLIRTSGEIRLSNFLLYQIAYSEIYITDVLWPEFTKEELYKAIYSYNKRDRRYGKRKEEQ